ncbi:hypothetical protein PWEIH_07176 [Listeria weihenstephanensis FSL R9-0317]|uniref:Bacteriocin immunity protein n=1 Tax=Listeria weihenstephanensis TaxID=1006155 RepID=A0A1S7FXN2_9LIST|nr:bacteriocin immunity protein [Listeria weihenstephanensis]AQY52181.1 hypothetical protein UE46_14900 [Listeria weihenstephanensis]EUJ39470.1 hypothetical protein PWEIH_07176 [Listeria weihenstephanensis FSL R9-0317]
MEQGSKQLVHELYNSLEQPDMKEVKDALLKVYAKLKDEDSKDNIALIGPLVKFIYFTAFAQKLHFNEEQNKLIGKLSDIGKTAHPEGLLRPSIRPF